jgi:hypothetical protein
MKYMNKDPLKIQSHVLLGILILQYLFGMAVNLFVQFPNSKSQTVLWEFTKSQAALVIHMILGVLLFVGACVFVMRAVQSKKKQWIISSSVGLFAIFVAVAAGAQFIPTQQDIYSFIMAAAFILAVVAYGWGIYKARK